MGGINNDPYYSLTEVVFAVITFSILAYYLPLLITLFVLVPLVFKLYTKLTVGVCKSYERIDGKTVIITGANVGIGLETAKDMARRGGRIILACRNMGKGKQALDEIQRDTGNNNVILKHLDLSSLDSVRKFSQEIIIEEPKLDILINNAGASILAKVLTKDNLETNMQANHFGAFLLTNLLLDLMHRTGKARIINVSSNAHSHPKIFDSENLNSEKSFSLFSVYGLTKLANIYFTTELNRRLKSSDIKGITVNSLHPGAVRTAFLSDTSEIWYLQFLYPIARFFFKTSEEGAQTTILLAVSEEVANISGEYFVDCQKSSTSKLGKSTENAKILWEKSVKAVGLKAQETIVPL